LREEAIIYFGMAVKFEMTEMGGDSAQFGQPGLHVADRGTLVDGHGEADYLAENQARPG
jgi:hypothetical protein